MPDAPATQRYRLVELDYANSVAYEDGDPLGLSDMVSSESRHILWTREMTAEEAADYAENPGDVDRLEPPNTGDLLQGETTYCLEVFRDGKWVYTHGVTVPSEDEDNEPSDTYFETLSSPHQTD